MGFYLNIPVDCIHVNRSAFSVICLHRFRSLQGKHTKFISLIFQHDSGSRANRQAFARSGYHDSRLLSDVFFSAQRNAVSS